jgi:uncharacterized membrane protein YkoI
MNSASAKIRASLLLALGALATADAHGLRFDPGVAPPLPEARAERHNGISLDEAVSRAEQRYNARVVRTEVQDEDGRRVYVLKLLSDNGRVFTVRIDAATGQMR